MPVFYRLYFLVSKCKTPDAHINPRQKVLHRKGPDSLHKMKVSSKAKSYINIIYFASRILLRVVTLHCDNIILSSK